ncbi:MAG: 4-hydroxy-tetrahydrodipicolinate reductase [candidate division WOR-3 bacterium]
MIGIIIIGAGGRMGNVVAQEIKETNDMAVIYGVEKEGHPAVGSPFGKNLIVDKLEKVIREGDVVVDFSEREAVLSNREMLIQGGKPYLCGVTGFREEEFKDLKEMGRHIPFLYSPNFSFGANLLIRSGGEIARFLPEDYEIKIIETHHRMKKDAPSGTAKRLVTEIEEKRGKKVEVFSLRAGEIVGEHRVIFFGPGEVLEITHSALSRKAFVRGVLAGIRFIINQPRGFYTFDDVIKKI